jgi:hypothetical protein
VSDEQTTPATATADAPPAAETPKPRRRRLLVVTLEVLLLLLLVGTLYLKLTASGQDVWDLLAHGSARAVEADAAAKLTAIKNPNKRSKYLVISETHQATTFPATILQPFLESKPDRQVTSINYQAQKIDDEALKLTSLLRRISTVNAAD